MMAAKAHEAGVVPGQNATSPIDVLSKMPFGYAHGAISVEPPKRQRTTISSVVNSPRQAQRWIFIPGALKLNHEARVCIALCFQPPRFQPVPGGGGRPGTRREAPAFSYF